MYMLIVIAHIFLYQNVTMTRQIMCATFERVEGCCTHEKLFITIITLLLLIEAFRFRRKSTQVVDLVKVSGLWHCVPG
jgi:hypothetical protein